MSQQIDFNSSYSYEDAIGRAAAENRIDKEYWDIFRQRHETSTDIARGILSALGWDVSSTEAIDRERAKRFHEHFTSVLPVTAVLSEWEKVVTLTFPEDQNGSLSFEIALEDGQQLSGALDLSQLEHVRHVSIDGRRWTARRLWLPAELPLGYHSLRVSRDGRSAAQCELIVCPDRAYLPEHLAHGGCTAGFNVTLYGLRSDKNWGCGDFRDLRAVIDWAHDDVGFTFIGLNPLHALHNRIPYNTSPYLPLSLYYKNLIYIDVESVPEFSRSDCARSLFSSARVQDKIRQLRHSEFVAYHEVNQLKRKFLKILYRQFRKSRAQYPARAQEFDAYCEREGDLLHNFALYSTLDEILHKQDRNRWTWQHWPTEYHSPASPESKRFAEQHALTLGFYKYIQFVIDEQLAGVQSYAKQRGMPIGLYHDLALATDSCGSDLWAYRDFYVNGCRVGAPPDDFSPNGQDWAFPPPHSDAHRNSGYRLYRASIRKIVSKGGALRIDHVMRLFRLFWIPDNATAAQGAYVGDYAADLMRILALESVRSQNLVIGEDLGTVTDEIRDTLGRFGILSYRVFYFEKHQDKSFKHSWEYPQQALIASSTHDLPTMCGFWTGRDIEARRAAGLADEHGYWSQIADRRGEKQQMLDVLHSENLLPGWYPRDAAQVPDVDGELHNAIIGFLSRVPSMLLLLNQEDLTKETEQQNLPGSTSEYPNWQRKMQVKVEDLRSPAYQPFAVMFGAQLKSTNRKS